MDRTWQLISSLLLSFSPPLSFFLPLSSFLLPFSFPPLFSSPLLSSFPLLFSFLPRDLASWEEEVVAYSRPSLIRASSTSSTPEVLSCRACKDRLSSSPLPPQVMALVQVA